MKRTTPRVTKPRTAKVKAIAPALAPVPTNVVPMPAVGSRPKAVKTSARPRPQAAPTTEAIALRAYQIFESRQGAHGNHEDDWLRAEAELVAELKAAKRKKASA
jgi:hypothetical protein